MTCFGNLLYAPEIPSFIHQQSSDSFPSTSLRNT
ncbi:CLUMA_CG021325, isoform A [Clunio marinus]|uniref:CLUMA_CG021325, isoform A n=1 Tax=Clunio marinus TaxID=568069 RepID=A0A1J1J8H4_9DIPT|nr:CLUMA_CG021325, isoform A [Clunio marinus]